MTGLWLPWIQGILAVFSSIANVTKQEVISTALSILGRPRTSTRLRTLFPKMELATCCTHPQRRYPEQSLVAKRRHSWWKSKSQYPPWILILLGKKVMHTVVLNRWRTWGLFSEGGFQASYMFTRLRDIDIAPYSVRQNVYHKVIDKEGVNSNLRHTRLPPKRRPVPSTEYKL